MNEESKQINYFELGWLNFDLSIVCGMVALVIYVNQQTGRDTNSLRAANPDVGPERCIDPSTYHGFSILSHEKTNTGAG